MRKAIQFTIPAIALLSLGACGGGAPNEANSAAESLSGDSNTMGEAVDDTKAAVGAAFNNAEGSYSETGGNTAGLDTSVPDGSDLDE